MSPSQPLRVRRSIVELQDDYDKGNKKPLLDLLRAWQGIKDLPYQDLRSFFTLGGYHGEPFRGPGEYSSSYWGGYCNHGNVLFPTWHRVYCLKIEEALRSIPGCEDVTLPYWDETQKYLDKNSGEMGIQGVPWALTARTIADENGQPIDNPLLSYKLPLAILDQIQADSGDFSRPKGYETVRYPLSGLMGDATTQQQTQEHNAQFTNYDTNVQLLNENVIGWLNNTIVLPGSTTPLPIGVYEEYARCLDAPNYTVFSNTTSAQQWNEAYDPTSSTQDLVVPLEQPHNDMHLAVGGFDVPNQGDFSVVAGANGDMGENDTAALDPIFYFHHCNVDRVFWLWQQKHQRTDYLDIIPNYPGTNSNDSQSPTPGYAPDTWLNLDSPLNPFQKYTGEVYTSNDCINIETQLGYTYSAGSLEENERQELLAAREAAPPATRVLRVSNINRAPIKGSFVVAVYHQTGELVGYHSVLSRWDPVSCSNCQTHLEVKAHFPLRSAATANAAEDDFNVHIIHRPQDTPYLERFAAYNQESHQPPTEQLAQEVATEHSSGSKIAEASTAASNLLAKRLAVGKPYRLSIK